MTPQTTLPAEHSSFRLLSSYQQNNQLLEQLNNLHFVRQDIQEIVSWQNQEPTLQTIAEKESLIQSYVQELSPELQNYVSPWAYNELHWSVLQWEKQNTNSYKGSVVPKLIADLQHDWQRLIEQTPLENWSKAQSFFADWFQDLQFLRTNQWLSVDEYQQLYDKHQYELVLLKLTEVQRLVVSFQKEGKKSVAPQFWVDTFGSDEQEAAFFSQIYLLSTQHSKTANQVALSNVEQELDQAKQHLEQVQWLDGFFADSRMHQKIEQLDVSAVLKKNLFGSLQFLQWRKNLQAVWNLFSVSDQDRWLDKVFFPETEIEEPLEISFQNFYKELQGLPPFEWMNPLLIKSFFEYVVEHDLELVKDDSSLLESYLQEQVHDKDRDSLQSSLSALLTKQAEKTSNKQGSKENKQQKFRLHQFAVSYYCYQADQHKKQHLLHNTFDFFEKNNLARFDTIPLRSLLAANLFNQTNKAAQSENEQDVLADFDQNLTLDQQTYLTTEGMHSFDETLVQKDRLSYSQNMLLARLNRMKVFADFYGVSLGQLSLLQDLEVEDWAKTWEMLNAKERFAILDSLQNSCGQYGDAFLYALYPHLPQLSIAGLLYTNKYLNLASMYLKLSENQDIFSQTLVPAWFVEREPLHSAGSVGLQTADLHQQTSKLSTTLPVLITKKDALSPLFDHLWPLVQSHWLLLQNLGSAKNKEAMLDDHYYQFLEQAFSPLYQGLTLLH